MTPINPYVAGNPVGNTPAFVGRNPSIEKLADQKLA